MSKLYIVTNLGGGQNYTPSVFGNKEDALSWMDELTIGNLSGMVDVPEDKGIFSDPDFLEYAKKIGEYEVKVFKGNDTLKETRILGEPDEYGNILQLFELDMPEDVKKVVIQEKEQKDYEKMRSYEEQQCLYDVETFIQGQDEALFTSFGVSKEEVLACEPLINELVSEHHRNVYKYDCDFDWSLDEVMYHEPGLENVIQKHLL